MQKQVSPSNISNSPWFDCFGQLNDVGNYDLQLLSLFSEIENHDHKESTEKNSIQLKDYTNQDLIDMISMHQSAEKEILKRSHPEPMIDEEFFTSNSSSSDIKNSENGDAQQEETKSGYKKEKYAKQYIYSKNYRDKKKEQFKALEQQNRFLKNKVDELHMRLREMEMEINRLKHHSNEKELTIEELNRQYMTELQLVCQKIENNLNLNEKQSLQTKSRSFIEEQFNKRYEQHGIYGKNKKQILNYHMNEILQDMLRDSEKYFCMLCCKNKNDNLEQQIPEYQKINTAFLQIMELKDDDITKIKSFAKIIFPVMKEIKKECSEMYKSYKKILTLMDRVHQFIKISYLQNTGLLIKRMKLQSWFQYNKYHKIMRKLKAEWIQFIKNGKQSDISYRNKQQRGCKKQKTQKMSEN